MATLKKSGGEDRVGEGEEGDLRGGRGRECCLLAP